MSYLRHYNHKQSIKLLKHMPYEHKNRNPSRSRRVEVEVDQYVEVRMQLDSYVGRLPTASTRSSYFQQKSKSRSTFLGSQLIDASRRRASLRLRFCVDLRRRIIHYTGTVIISIGIGIGIGIGVGVGVGVRNSFDIHR